MCGGIGAGVEQGRTVVTAPAQKYDPAEFDKLWQSASATGRVTLGTLFHHAQQAGWSSPVSVAPPAQEVRDLRNAKAFADANRGQLLFVHETGDVLQFGPYGWETAAVEAAGRAAKEIVAAFAREASQLASQDPTGSAAKDLLAHVNFSSTAQRIDAMITLAKSEPGMSVRLAGFDADPWLLGVKNGVLNLKTLHMEKVRPDLLVSKRTNVSFDSQATCPLFDWFLETIQPDADTRRLLQQLCGIFLTGEPHIQKLIFFYGLGANGKSTFIELVHWLLGDYAKRIQTELLMQHQRSPQGPSPDIVALKGRRLVYCNEIEEGRRLAEARVKELTGGDTLSGRTPYAKEEITFQPSHNLVMVGNHAPEVRDMSHGMWRRMLLIPFDQVIAADQQDAQLSKKLRGEGDGVLNWALAGLADYLKNGLVIPAEVQRATDAYKTDQDILAEWMSDHCEVVATAVTPKVDIYAAYRNWAVAHGHQPMSQTKVTRRLRECHYPQDAGRRNIMGLELNDDGRRAVGGFLPSAQFAPKSV